MVFGGVVCYVVVVDDGVCIVVCVVVVCGDGVVVGVDGCVDWVVVDGGGDGFVVCGYV